MDFIHENERLLKQKEFHTELLSLLQDLKDPFIYYLDKKNDTIHYLIFGKKTIFLQVIFQKKDWNMHNNFDILEYGISHKKIAKNYLSSIDEIIQYNLLFFPNTMRFNKKEWTFKDENEEFPEDYYSIFLLNLYHIMNHDKSALYKPLCNFWTSYL